MGLIEQSSVCVTSFSHALPHLFGLVLISFVRVFLQSHLLPDSFQALHAWTQSTTLGVSHFLSSWRVLGQALPLHDGSLVIWTF